MPGIEIVVVGEQRRALPTGQVGELACRGDSVMLGYYRAPERTAEVIDEGGWYYTGDLAADSIQWVQLMFRTEELGIGIPSEYAFEVETVGDAYQLYRKHCAA
jgi:long-subunit acyl-CoA synthetase (AMP-forming)